MQPYQGGDQGQYMQGNMGGGMGPMDPSMGGPGMGGMGGPGMGGPGMGGMGGPGMGPGMADPSMMGGPGMMAGERIFPAVKLRGLPFDAAEDDIRMFLGCDPVDILLVHRGGRLSGEAFVVLSSPMQIDVALSKNRTYLGRRYIEVYRTKKMDYYKAIVSEMMEGQGGGAGYGNMGMYEQGGYQGGMQGHGGYQGGYQAGYQGGMQGGGGPMGEPNTTILKLRGLPFTAQDDDIVRWFNDAGLGITPITTDSVFIAHEGGRPTGIAFVEFASPQEAVAAMAKNKQMMGSRYIECFLAQKGDLERYRAKGGAY